MEDSGEARGCPVLSNKNVTGWAGGEVERVDWSIVRQQAGGVLGVMERNEG